MIIRPHVLLMHLVDGGAGTALTGDRAADILRRVRRREGPAATRRQLAVALVAEVRHLDRRITAADAAVTDVVKRSRTLLVQLHGVGPVLAARIIGRAGPISRFTTADQFAS